MNLHLFAKNRINFTRNLTFKWGPRVVFSNEWLLIGCEVLCNLKKKILDESSPWLMRIKRLNWIWNSSTQKLWFPANCEQKYANGALNLLFLKCTKKNDVRAAFRKPILGGCFLDTPPKINIEPENAGLEDDFSFSRRPVFSGSMLIFRGVVHFFKSVLRLRSDLFCPCQAPSWLCCVCISWLEERFGIKKKAPNPMCFILSHFLLPKSQNLCPDGNFCHPRIANPNSLASYRPRHHPAVTRQKEAGSSSNHQCSGAIC